MDQQKRKELDDLKNELSEEHMDNAFLLSALRSMDCVTKRGMMTCWFSDSPTPSPEKPSQRVI